MRKETAANIEPQRFVCVSVWVMIKTFVIMTSIWFSRPYLWQQANPMTSSPGTLKMQRRLHHDSTISVGGDEDLWSGSAACFNMGWQQWAHLHLMPLQSRVIYRALFRDRKLFKCVLILHKMLTFVFFFINCKGSHLDFLLWSPSYVFIYICMYKYWKMMGRPCGWKDSWLMMNSAEDHKPNRGRNVEGVVPVVAHFHCFLLPDSYHQPWALPVHSCPPGIRQAGKII